MYYLRPKVLSLITLLPRADSVINSNVIASADVAAAAAVEDY